MSLDKVCMRTFIGLVYMRMYERLHMCCVIKKRPTRDRSRFARRCTPVPAEPDPLSFGRPLCFALERPDRCHGARVRGATPARRGAKPVTARCAHAARMHAGQICWRGCVFHRIHFAVRMITSPVSPPGLSSFPPWNTL